MLDSGSQCSHNHRKDQEGPHTHCRGKTDHEHHDLWILCGTIMELSKDLPLFEEWSCDVSLPVVSPSHLWTPHWLASLSHPEYMWASDRTRTSRLLRQRFTSSYWCVHRLGLVLGTCDRWNNSGGHWTSCHQHRAEMGAVWASYSYTASRYLIIMSYALMASHRIHKPFTINSAPFGS